MTGRELSFEAVCNFMLYIAHEVSKVPIQVYLDGP